MNDTRAIDRALLLLVVLGGMPASGADVSLAIPPIPIHLDVNGRALVLMVSGTVSATAAAQGQESLRVKLDADLSDVQRNLAELLRAQLNQSERCGDRISVQDATLFPAAPAGELTAKIHFEKWACAKAFGKEIAKKLVGGDGTVGVRLTPKVDEGNALQLAADVTSVDATGQLGEMLRSGPLGDALREKIRRAVVSALRKMTDWKDTLPATLQEMVEIRSAEFRDGGAGMLLLSLTSELRVPAGQAGEMLDKLKLPQKH